jgi:hypothetical protein
MTLKNRLQKLEEVKEAEKPLVIRVYLKGADGLLRRHDPGGNLIETITQAEYDQVDPDITKLRIVYDKTDPRLFEEK